MNKYDGLHPKLVEILKQIKEVNKTMRSKKICFDQCDDERIKKLYAHNLYMDLSLLSILLNEWNYDYECKVLKDVNKYVD